MRTFKYSVSVKDPDGLWDLSHELGLAGDEDGNGATYGRWLEFGEYAVLEMTVSEDMTFVGRFVPVKDHGR